MKGIILAAGKGTRLRPLTYAIPKPLLPVGGKPILDYSIDAMLECKEIDEIFVAVSHKKETVEEYLGHTARGSKKISVVGTLGWETWGDIKTICIDKDIHEPIVVMYGDNVTHYNVTALAKEHCRLGTLMTTSLVEVPWKDVSRFGCVKVENGLITQFVEKPPQKDAPSNLVHVGCYLMDAALIAEFPLKKTKTEYYIVPELLQRKQLGGFRMKLPFWFDIGDINAYQEANHLVRQILPPGPEHQH